MKERIRQVRKEAGLTREAFGQRIGVTMNYVYLMESGRKNPSPATVREICRQFAVRERWLTTGEGEMHYDQTPAVEASDRIRRLLVDAPNSTAARVISSLVALDPFGPEWEMIGSLLRSINETSPEA